MEELHIGTMGSPPASGAASRRGLLALGAAIGLAIVAQSVLLHTQRALPAIPLFLAAIALGSLALRLHAAPEAGFVAPLHFRASPAWQPVALIAVGANAAALVLLALHRWPNLALLLFVASIATVIVAAWLFDGRPRLAIPWRRERLDLLILGGLLLLGSVIRLIFLDRLPYGFWYDEANGSLLAQHLLSDPNYRPVFFDFPGPDSPLYPYLAAPFQAVLGPHALAWRLPAALGGIVGILAAFLAGRTLFGRAAGLITAAIMTTLPWQVTFSREAISGNVWAVTFDMLAMAFLVRALKRGSWTSAALAGVMLGLGLDTYVASQLMAAVLLLTLLLFWLRRPHSYARTVLPLAVAFGVAALLVTSPLLEFAVQHPRQFSRRTQMVNIFTEMQQRHSNEPLLRSVSRHLLMFNVQGDANGRHNLPGAPELNAILAGLAVLGLGLCLIRYRRPEYLLMPFWWAAVLSGGIFSVVFEAPQSLRTFDEVNVVALLAALPLSLAVQAAGSLRTARPPTAPAAGARSPTSARAARRLLAALASPALWTLLAVAGLLAYSGAMDVWRYFGIQQRNASVYAEHSTTATIIARQARTLPPGTTVYMDQQVIGQPTLAFLAPGVKQTPFEDSLLPLRGATPTVIYLGADNQTALQLLQTYYPKATVQRFGPPFGGNPLIDGILLQPADISAIQGVRATFQSAGSAATPLVRTLPSADLPASDLAVPVPTTVTLRSVLLAPTYGAYEFQLQGPLGAQLMLDGQQVAQAAHITLAKGTHLLEVRATLGQGDGLHLLWQPPSTAQLTPLPQQALYAERVRDTGLLGSYFSNATWTAPPAFQQVDPQVDFDFHLMPLNRPYSIEWNGQLDAPVAGLYHFGTTSIDASALFLDGRLLFDNTTPNSYQDATVTLSAGLHALRLRYAAVNNYDHVQLYWQPPNGDRQILPTAYLFPSSAASQAQALPVLPAATPPVQVASAPAAGVRSGAVETLPALWQINMHTLFADSIPAGLAVDAAGNIYVADQGHHALEKLDSSGKLLWSVAPPAGAGTLGDPDAVALAPDGNAWLLDSTDGTLYHFSPSGQYQGKDGGPAIATYNPRGLAIGPDGDLYLVDTGRGRVVRLSPTGAVKQTFGTQDQGAGALGQPTSVAVLAGGQLAVLDPGSGNVVIFSPSGALVRTWHVNRSATVNGPQLVADSNSLWLTDQGSNQILHDSLSGQQLAAYTAPGLLGPSALAIGNGVIVISEPSTAKIVALRAPPGP